MFKLKKRAKEEVSEKTEQASVVSVEREKIIADEEIREPAVGISAEEMEEFEEFKRQKKLMEIRRMLKKIDHTLLKQTASKAELKKLCDEAKEYGFCSVCVQPVHVREVYNYLGNCAVNIACVIGFPMGENMTEVKVYETKKAVSAGADEIDMVACISAIKNGNYSYVKKEIKKVVAAAKGRPVKVILETSLLTREELVKACVCAKDGGASFVKTSTGYFGEGARIEDVIAMKEAVKGECFVKASGGIRNGEQFKAMLEAGADRIGTSAGVQIAKDLYE